ncbi:hypothetical protein KA977_03990 [Candidatus Dependentiae bacterium]|nr:hypothetical protein [Candidatus Dependentiae bacterium]
MKIKNEIEFNEIKYSLDIWTSETGNIGDEIGLDTETEEIHEGEVPELILGTVFNGKMAYIIYRENMKEFTQIHNLSTFYIMNAKFDIMVIEKITGLKLNQQIENGNIIDPGILFRLKGIAESGIVPAKYNLALLSEKILGIKLEKNIFDVEGLDVRTNFGQFMNSDKTIRYENIPDYYIEYAVKDSISSFFVTKKLIEDCENIMKEFRLSNEYGHLTHKIQIMGDYALGKIMLNGICVDLDYVKKIEKLLDDEKQKTVSDLKAFGYNTSIPGSTKIYDSIIRKIESEHNIIISETEKTKFKSQSADDLKKFAYIPFIKCFLVYKKNEQLLSTFIRKLDKEKIFAYYDLLKVTGRSSCSKPNLQNLPRSGKVRECFIPSPGNIFISIDYCQLELVALAQICYTNYKISVMRELINNDIDLHKWFASKIYDKPVNNISDEERRTAKACNFGFPGGMGITAFQRNLLIEHNIALKIERCAELKKIWLTAFPEMKKFIAEDKKQAVTLTGRLRSNMNYCDYKNTQFQGLAADGAKIALYNLTKNNYRTAAFVHDEAIIELPLNSDYSYEAERISEIMINSMRKVCPDVKVKTEYSIMDRWYKSAKAVFDENNKLVMWQPEKA